MGGKSQNNNADDVHSKHNFERGLDIIFTDMTTSFNQKIKDLLDANSINTQLQQPQSLDSDIILAGE